MNYNFDLGEQDRQQLISLVYEKTGIYLDSSKHDLIQSRFSKRMRALGVEQFGDYINYFKENEVDEIEHFSNAISTNLTSFFREEHHFETLGKEVVPELRKKSDRRIRIWSAGCSTGEEPYSIAFTLLANIPDITSWDVKILATDLDTEVLHTASTGIYPVDRIDKLKDSIKQRWFKEVETDSAKPHVCVNPKAKSLITFKQLNLMKDLPMKGPFDVVFCRNVVIYFDKPTQSTLFDKFADLQGVGDRLFVGHSENISKVTDRYKHIARTVYKKI